MSPQIYTVYSSTLLNMQHFNRVIPKCPLHIWGKDCCGKAQMEPTWKVESCGKNGHQRFRCYLDSSVVKVYIASSILIMSSRNDRPGLWNGHEQLWAARNEQGWNCGLRFIVFDRQTTSIRSQWRGKVGLAFLFACSSHDLFISIYNNLYYTKYLLGSVAKFFGPTVPLWWTG